MNDEQKTTLGFGPSLRARYLYVNPEKSATGWYFWNHNAEEAEAVDAPALTGYIRDIDRAEKQYKGKPVVKLHVRISCGARESYVIETGLYTAFSRCLLASLAPMIDAGNGFDTSYAIEPHPGDEACFADVYDATTGIRLDQHYPESEADVDDLFASLYSVFHDGQKPQASAPASANGQGGRAPTPPPQPQAPPAPHQQANGQPEKVTKGMQVALWNAAKETGYSEEQMKKLLEEEGISGFEAIPSERYGLLMEYARSPNKRSEMRLACDDDLPF